MPCVPQRGRGASWTRSQYRGLILTSTKINTTTCFRTLIPTMATRSSDTAAPARDLLATISAYNKVRNSPFCIRTPHTKHERTLALGTFLLGFSVTIVLGITTEVKMRPTKATTLMPQSQNSNSPKTRMPNKLMRRTDVRRKTSYSAQCKSLKL